MGTITGTVKQLLAAKHPDVWTIRPEASVYEALELMAAKDIGAVPVVEDGELRGIFSERDYARKVALRGRTSRETSVGELMTQLLFVVTPDETIEECLDLMTNKRVRHLPVLDGTRLTGIVSIGDVVKYIITAQQVAIQDLECYITGRPVRAS